MQINRTQQNNLDEELALLRGVKARYHLSPNFTHPQYSEEEVDELIKQLEREIHFNSKPY